MLTRVSHSKYFVAERLAVGSSVMCNYRKLSASVGSPVLVHLLVVGSLPIVSLPVL